MNKVMRWIRRWFCCSSREDEVRRIYDEICQIDDDCWSGEI